MDMHIKVTNINDEYHARLYNGEQVLDEMSCKLSTSIGWICREMLRWQDKLGNVSDWTSFSRHKQCGPKPDDVKYIGVK